MSLKLYEVILNLFLDKNYDNDLNYIPLDVLLFIFMFIIAYCNNSTITQINHDVEFIINEKKFAKSNYNLIVLVHQLSIAYMHKENYKSKFNIPSNAIVIGMAARIHYWKGQQYFLEIAEQLIATENRNEPLYFLISGDAFPGYEYLLDEMKAFIKEHTLNSRVFYIGFETEMDNFYKSIDVLVLPSQLPDPLPTVVLEAMRYGLPIAATEQGGALEMIHENGIFLPLFDANASAKKIGSILPSEIRKKLGQAGQKRVEAFFSVTAFENNILHVFET